jgi:hypothetical protein
MRDISRLLRRMATCRWQCWICHIEVDNYLTHCPNSSAH